MTTRTFQFFGTGYGPETVNITATLDGNVVYQGAIPTVPTFPDWTVPASLLYTVEGIPFDFTGIKPVTVVVENGNAIIEEVLSNYNQIQNPIYSNEQFTLVTIVDKTDTQKAASIEVFKTLAEPPLSAEEITTLEDPVTTSEQVAAILDMHNLTYIISSGIDGFNVNFYIGDSRSNVAVDGIPQSAPIPRPGGLDGDWAWNVGSGSTLTYDLNIGTNGLA